MGKRLLLLLICSVCAWGACARDRHAAEEMYAQSLRRLVEQRRMPAFLEPVSSGPIWKSVQRFYQQRAYAPAWFDGRRPRREITALLSAIGNARFEGLDPRAYDPGDAARLEYSINPF